ncbi:MAG: ABC1 kinase family protein [Blastocatellia bacterium]
MNEHGETHTHRYRQIAETLTRHGLGYMLGSFGLDRFAHAGPAAPEDAGLPGRVRMALEELGATFIKLGQLLSTRPDLLSPEFQHELARLQDDAPPFASAMARARIEAELGQPIDTLFAAFTDTPLAAASIGQAHAARLHDGTEVVIKVRRPGVVEQIHEDLEILRNLAATAQRRWRFAARYDVAGLVTAFSRTLRAELDYLHEADSAERFAANFAGHAAVHIPRVFPDLTTSRVLTLERIRGARISELSGLATPDAAALAGRGTEVILKMIFEDGFFHADLHPGNFFIEADGRFGLIDFGMTGEVSEETREKLAQFVYAITRRDYARLTEAVFDLGITGPRLDRRALTHDLEHLIEPWQNRPLGEIRLTALLGEALAVIRRHQLRLPPDLALLIKTIIITEGLGTRLDPSFHLTQVIAPYAEQLMLRQMAPRRVARKLGHAGLDLARLGVELPRQLRALLGDLERGGLDIGLRAGSLEPLLTRLERLTNRLVLGMLAAAFIVGLAALLAVYHPPGWERWAGWMFATGFFLALVLGLYLAWSILRGR